MARLSAGLVCTAILAIAQPASAQPRPCTVTGEPVVHLDGAPAAAVAIRDRLSAAGVAVIEAGHDDACATVRVTVLQLAAGLSVSITEDDDAGARRTVSTPAIAAAWIESRIRRDLGAPLLPAVFLRRGPAPPLVAPTDRVDEPPVARGRAVDAWSISLASASVAGDDASTWRTIDAGVCVRVGAVCLGVDARFGEAGELSANDGLTLARRRAGDLIVSVGAPLRVGVATLTPSAGLGLGFTHVRRDEPTNPGIDPPGPGDPGCTDPNDPGDPTFPDPCDPEPLMPPYYIGDDFRAWSVGLRLSTAAALTLPLSSAVAVELGAGVTLAPSAHRGAFEPVSGDNGVGPDGMTAPPDPFMQLPGEPGRTTWWSIGVRWQP